MTSPNPPTIDQDIPMSKEDVAYFIRSMWESLLIPNWARGDLIDLGMAVFTKTTLGKMDQEKLGKLLPNLYIVAEHFGKKVGAKFSADFDAYLKAAARHLASKSAVVTGPAPIETSEPATESSTAEPEGSQTQGSQTQGSQTQGSQTQGETNG